MNVVPLTPKAESIRNEIKTLVTNNASVAFEDDSGKKYYSLAIVTAVKQLAIELGVYHTGWGFSLRYFTQARELINETGRIVLVPLTEGVALLPGGRVNEGFSAFIHNNQCMTPNVRVLMLGPGL